MITKQVVLDSLKQLPDEFSIDELIERVYLMRILNERSESARKGNTISHEEVKELIKKW